MTSLRPGKDVQTLSAFRANAAGFLEQVRESRRPLVITQHGKSAAVLLGAEQYDALLDELDVVRDIREARAQLERGEAVPHEEAIASLRARIPD
jgi:prevent-host-death family protein